ncbi:MAG: ribonuclease R [Planctomycetota bacterium]|jgi:ribonuclease R
MASIKRQILDFVRQSGYEPMRPRQLAKRIGLKKKDRVRFEDSVETLIAKGKLERSEDGRLIATGKAPSSQLVPGILRRTMNGAWFIPDPLPAEPASDSETEAAIPRKPIEDVFIYSEHLGDAHTGDRVLIRLISRRHAGGRRTGRVEQVIERATRTFVGTYFEEWNQGKVRIDGGVFADAVSVGDPGAKGAVPGDKVVVEMIRFPSHFQAGEAVLTKILGARGEPGVDEQAIIHEFGLPETFPEEVLAEARDHAAAFDETDLSGRLDLTRETIVTIDPVDARDFDDAISLQKIEKDHWLLGVHIADVAHFVREGSRLDDEAKKRGTSVYLPGRVIPMLPETISNALASLQQSKVRFTKTVFIEFTPDGVPVRTEFHRSAIKVTRRFAYEQVLPIIEKPDEFRGKVSEKVRKLLHDMHELAMTLRRRRFEHGALELYLPEVKVELDKDGRVSGAKEVEHDESHQIIEEFMLAANCAIATEIRERNITFLRRVHGSPDPVKLQAFAHFVESLGLTLNNHSSRFELQELLDDVKSKSFEQAVNFSLLRSMKQAEYSPANDGHYALAVDNYCHFTSPIRRYPDLTVHRLIDQIVDGRPNIGLDTITTLKLATHCSMTERRAAQAERDLTRVKLLSFIAGRLDEVFDAVITGVTKAGIYCRCSKYPVDGFIHVSALSDREYLEFDRTTMTITGRTTGFQYRMGDRLKVRVATIDPDERVLNWELVKGPQQSGRGRPEGKRAERDDSRKSARTRRNRSANGSRRKASSKKKSTRRKRSR